MTFAKTECPTTEELRLDFYGHANDDSRHRVQEHLDHCAACVARLDALKFSWNDPSAAEDRLNLSLKELTNSHDVRTFDAIGPYRVERKIGQGAMGEVFLCTDLRLNRHVAAKTILPRFVTPEAFGRISQEARLHAGLNHPHIVRLYDYGVTQTGSPYLVMEFVDGQTLKDRLKKALLTPRSAAMLIRDCAVAMAYAHEQGVLHRDLKPSNILLAIPSASDSLFEGEKPDFTPKIADFGLAKSIGVEAQVNQSGSVVGTPAYMAPEQIHAGASVGRETDIYALGVILFECLTGTPVFRADSLATTLRMIEESTPDFPFGIEATIPKDLQTICLKCLEKRPEDRYATAQALAEDLERFLSGRIILARPVHWTTHMSRWCTRNRALAASLAITFASLAALAAGGIAFGWRQAELRERADRSAREADAQRQAAVNANAKAREKEIEASKDRDFALDLLMHYSNALYLSFLDTIGKKSLDEMELKKIRESIIESYFEIAAKTRGAFGLGKFKPELLIDLNYRAGVMYWENGDRPAAVKRFEEIQRIAAQIPADVSSKEDVAAQCISAATMIAWARADQGEKARAVEDWLVIWNQWRQRGAVWLTANRKATIQLKQLANRMVSVMREIGRTDEADSLLVDLHFLNQILERPDPQSVSETRQSP
jgi:serine/threonine protein kinase